MYTNEFNKGMNDIIRDFCKHNGWSHTYFANRAEINVSHLCRKLGKDNDKSLDTLSKCLDTMNVDKQKVLDCIRKHAIDDQPPEEKPSPPKAKRKRKRLPKS